VALFPAPKRDQVLQQAAIDSLNVWGRYCRYFYLSCALGGRDGNGNSVMLTNPKLPSVEQAITLAIHTVSPNKAWNPGPFGVRDEPDWKVPAVFLNAMAALQPANLTMVQAALSVPTAATSRLVVFRNFYAHRSQDTARKALQQGVQMGVVGTHPGDVLLSVPTTDSLITEWVFDLQLMIDLMN
jgi:hypothetical protein